MDKYVFDNYLGEIVFPSYDKTISGYIEEFGVWEPKEFQWLFENVKEGDVCINIGANVGYFSAVISKLVNKNGKVYAIEANPEFEKYIQMNTNLSGFNNVEIIMSAAGNTSGEIDLFINSCNSGDNRVFSPDIIKDQINDEVLEIKNKIKVKIDKTDNLIFSDRVDLVLIDCQGWDHEVIRGMSEIIKKHKPKILTEFVPKWINNLGENPEDVLLEYIGLGYKLLCPDLDINAPVQPKEILHAIEKSNTWFANIYLMPTGTYFGEDDIERIGDDYGK